MIRALVFPCASGVGQEVHAALEHHKDVQLYGANSGEANPGSYLFRDRYLGGAPPMRDEAACLGWLRAVVAAKSIDCIVPAYDDAQVWLKAREAELGGARVVTSPFATTDVCRSKRRTYSLLADKLRCPASFASADDVPDAAFPVFIKPECGEGSKGCHMVASRRELGALLTPEHIICEYLPGDEYTVDCLTDAARQLLFVGARRRTMTRAGISILTESVDDDAGNFRAMAASINDALVLVGAWFFQVKHAAGGELCLMEIAPRIPGAMALHRAMGVNFALLSLYVHTGRPVAVVPPPLRGVACCKIYANHFSAPPSEAQAILAALYVDLDDTLLMHAGHPLLAARRRSDVGAGAAAESAVEFAPRPNPSIVAILFEAFAARVPVHLITRHAGDVLATLGSACIHAGVFASVIHLTRAEVTKSSHILERPAALLDDSFRERADASRAGVLAFDVDSLELLRDLIRSSALARLKTT
jgi:carbamoyl-phosphate synthase large subunit